MTIAMPKDDALLIETRAKEAGVSVEVYIRRQFGFPNEPPCASCDEMRQIVADAQALRRESAALLFAAVMADPVKEGSRAEEQREAMREAVYHAWAEENSDGTFRLTAAGRQQLQSTSSLPDQPFDLEKLKAFHAECAALGKKSPTLPPTKARAVD